MNQFARIVLLGFAFIPARYGTTLFAHSIYDSAGPKIWTFLTYALDKFLDMLGDLPDEAAFVFELEIMVVRNGRPPGRLGRSSAATRRIRDPLVDIPLCFL